MSVKGIDNNTGRPLRPTTQALYMMTYRICIAERLGPRKLISIGPEEISTWREEMLKEHGAKTVLNAVQILGSLFRHARRFKWISGNPVEDVRKPRYKGEVHAFTTVEVDWLCEAVGDDEHTVLMIELAANTGRFGELIALR